jgi:hypothetical protein
MLGRFGPSQYSSPAPFATLDCPSLHRTSRTIWQLSRLSTIVLDVQFIVVAWQSGQPYNTLGHAAGAFLTSSGFGGLAALIAAYIAWRGIKANIDNVDRQLRQARENLSDQAQREEDKASKRDRLEAIVDGIEALAEAKHNIRQRDIGYKESEMRSQSDVLKAQWAQEPTLVAVADSPVLDKLRDAAASRHWTLPAASARLQLAGVDHARFDDVHHLINVYSNLSYKRQDKAKILEAELAAEGALKSLTEWFVSGYGIAGTASEPTAEQGGS